MKDSCHYCKYKKTYGYNQYMHFECELIGHELAKPQHTICDKYELNECYKKQREQEGLRKTFNFRTIK